MKRCRRRGISTRVKEFCRRRCLEGIPTVTKSTPKTTDGNGDPIKRRTWQRHAVQEKIEVTAKRGDRRQLPVAIISSPISDTRVTWPPSRRRGVMVARATNSNVPSSSLFVHRAACVRNFSDGACATRLLTVNFLPIPSNNFNFANASFQHGWMDVLLLSVQRIIDSAECWSIWLWWVIFIFLISFNLCEISIMFNYL